MKKLSKEKNTKSPSINKINKISKKKKNIKKLNSINGENSIEIKKSKTIAEEILKKQNKKNILKSPTKDEEVNIKKLNSSQGENNLEIKKSKTIDKKKLKNQNMKNILKSPTKEEEVNEINDTDENNENKTSGESEPIHKTKGMNKSKHGRLIIRNLPFKTNEDNLYAYLQTIGRIRQLNLLKKKDDSLVGCAFVQYWHKKHGEIAFEKLNNKKFLGRRLIFDWAVPKTQYNEIIKNEEKDEDEPEEDSKDNLELKQEDIIDNKDEKEEKEEEEDNKKPLSKFKFPGDYLPLNANDNEKIKKRKLSNDVSEGKTVFIKNIPFSAEEEDLKKLMEQYGELYYAKICIDRLTEHSKGTGFVKFHKKESADECLKAGTELQLNNQILDVFPALNRDEILNKKEKEKEKNQNKTIKDNRHLYLIKEGLILAGSKAARNVSMADMEKRLKLERWKSQMLKNLTMFISKERLIIHNIPPNWNNDKLKKIVKKYSRPNAQIKEIRIMRDVKMLDNSGNGKSKEFGFVSFTDHEDALTFLRKVNNNPDIFSVAKRPIVSFSIENRKILNLKQKRVDKSRLNNPTFQKKINTNDADKKKMKKNENKNKNNNNKLKDKITDEENIEESYSGLIAKPGQVKARSKLKMKTQSLMHHTNVNKLKRQQKMMKKSAEAKRIRNEKEKIPQKNMKSSKEDVDFNKLVNQYKSQITSASVIKRKWYDDS